MKTITSFYSTAGRTGIARFAIVAAITIAILYAVPTVDWTWGLVPNIVAGALGGAAFAKLLVEAIRRLRDAGISRTFAAWFALGAGILFGSAFSAFLLSDPPWADSVLTTLIYGLPIVSAIALVWPPRGGSDVASNGSRRVGIAIATLSIIVGAMTMGFIAWLSMGMDANNRAAAALEAERTRANRLP